MMNKTELRLECLKLVLEHGALGQGDGVNEVVRDANVMFDFVLNGSDDK